MYPIAEVCSVAEGCCCLYWWWWRHWRPPTQPNLCSLWSIRCAPTCALRVWVVPPAGSYAVMTWCSSCGPAWGSTLPPLPNQNVCTGRAAPFVRCSAAATSATRSAAATSTGEKRCQVYVVSEAIGYGPRSWHGQARRILDTPLPLPSPF